ncbi:MAG: DUF6465 family protein [Clostridiales bacterium]|nr:DUF6465 family protein [Clostridiales bacterium]
MEAAKKEAKVVAEPVAETVEENVTEPVAEMAAEEAAAPKKRGRKPGSSAKTAAKAEVKAALILQYGDNETEIGQIEDKVKAQFVAEGHRAGTIKTLNIYIKPEDYAAYYVINDKFSGRVDLF